MRIKAVSIVLILLFGSLQSIANIRDSIVHVQVKRLNDAFIDVYYNYPSGTLKKPVLLFCQGSGYDSNTKGFLKIMRTFDSLAVGMTIEKQGVHLGDKGDSLSEEYLLNNAVYNRIYDYLTVFSYLRTHATWWNGDVYIIGGSEGGLIAGMLATFYPDVKAVSILSFGGGQTFGELWPKAVAASIPDKLEAKKLETDVADSLKYIRTMGLTGKSFYGVDNTYAWWVSIMDLRLQNLLLETTLPIYLAQGSKDDMAPPASARMLRQSFSDLGKQNLTYKEYEGLNHGFADEQGRSQLVNVIKDAINWMFSETMPH